MQKQPPYFDFKLLGQRLPDATAILSGSPPYPAVRGQVLFYRMRGGVLVTADVVGLPPATEPCRRPIYALHIHEGDTCEGDIAIPFDTAGGHYNPDGCPHPYHAGDLPPLFGAGGRAFSAALTDRFTIAGVLGRTVILHAGPDDFTTQPAGGAGARIACGVITPTRRGA